MTADRRWAAGFLCAALAVLPAAAGAQEAASPEGATAPEGAAAQEAQPGVGPQRPESNHLGQFGSWDAYSYESAQGKVCALSSEPSVSSPAREGGVFFVITRRPGDPGYFEAAWRSGVRIPPDARPDLQIAQRRFSMYTGGARVGDAARWAWPENPKDTPRLLAAMRRGLTMKITLAAGGVQAQDLYSLKGVTAGLKEIAGACP